MNKLNEQIEDRKEQIKSKKEHLHDDLRAVKRRFTSGEGLSLFTLGGMVIGFLLLPKKFKILKSVLKAYTMAATVRQFVDLLPHSGDKSKNKSTSHTKHSGRYH